MSEGAHQDVTLICTVVFSRPQRQYRCSEVRVFFFSLFLSEIHPCYPLVSHSSFQHFNSALHSRYSQQNQRIVDCQRTQMIKLQQDYDNLKAMYDRDVPKLQCELKTLRERVNTLDNLDDEQEESPRRSRSPQS